MWLNLSLVAVLDDIILYSSHNGDIWVATTQHCQCWLYFQSTWQAIGLSLVSQMNKNFLWNVFFSPWQSEMCWFHYQVVLFRPLQTIFPFLEPSGRNKSLPCFFYWIETCQSAMCIAAGCAWIITPHILKSFTPGRAVPATGRRVSLINCRLPRLSDEWRYFINRLAANSNPPFPLNSVTKAMCESGIANGIAALVLSMPC